MPLITAGLRVDVDTFRGTREGVPRLLRVLDKHDINASFFFSVGPDNMGRHIWRLFRPAFLRKMLRSDAASLYGWRILLAGTAWPGRCIGTPLAATIRQADQDGHEVGLHAWDHHAWQTNIERWSAIQAEAQIVLGMECLGNILGRAVDCSATAGWKTTQTVIDVKEHFGFRYNSDCRGHALFRPSLSSGLPGTPQVPVDLPTYDEVVGSQVRADDYNGFILKAFKPGHLNVYTIHAEVEGGVMASQFDGLLTRAKARGIQFRPLGALLPSDPECLPTDRLISGAVGGREGWLAVQPRTDNW